PVRLMVSPYPVLSTLVTAVKKAGLVDTLNSAKDITVFAPTNDAFAAIPKATLDKVLADKETLTKILTYHVVAGKNAPADLASADLKTLQGGMLMTEGSDETYTANATVSIIDKVLMPK
ncbi:fasciclin domain-containing protein, partial [Nonomuraea sp. NPDC059023]|uniref:fasciclin domain-containing protein n=1 Tax=unclassified Nonomuraea TaxID=2593643 RepID=UPI0036A201D9